VSGSSALKKKRRAARADALAAIGELSDDELKNMQHELGREISQRANSIAELRSRQDAIRSEREKRATATTTGFHISDHAVLRYLERVKGVDVQAAREEIGRMAVLQKHRDSGEQYDRATCDQTGITFGVNGINNTITTVMTPREENVLRPVADHAKRFS